LQRVYEQYVIFNRPFERKVRRVRNVAAGHEVVTGAQHEMSVLFRHRELGDRLEANAAPMVVVPAPRRHAVKITDVFSLRQCEKLVPGEGKGILDEPGDLELPRGELDERLLAQIEHRPVLDLVLTNRQLRHAVTIRWSSAVGFLSAEPNVNRALVQGDLTL